jgi:P-type Ca2+ transporter type 2C
MHASARPDSAPNPTPHRPGTPSAPMRRSRELESDRSGLSAAEAASRFETYGANVLPEGEQRTLGHMILDQFKDFLILLLIGAAVIAGLLGEVTDTIAIA